MVIYFIIAETFLCCAFWSYLFWSRYKRRRAERERQRQDAARICAAQHWLYSINTGDVLVYKPDGHQFVVDENRCIRGGHYVLQSRDYDYFYILEKSGPW